MILVDDIVTFLEAWAPPAVAWEKDNVGLQIGDPGAEVSALLVALDVTPAVVEEAESLGANMIVAHHPLLYHPVRRLRADEEPGGLLREILSRGLHVAVAHTNADAAAGGVNHALALLLGLEDVEPLEPAGGGMTTSIFRLPDGGALARVKEYLDAAGVPDWFSFRLDEGQVCVQATAPSWRAAEIGRGVREIAGEELRVGVTRSALTAPPGFGMGAVGTLPEELPASRLVERIKERLSAERVRTNGVRNAPARRVAVCGGSGRALIGRALAAKAEAFVTADLTYHDFFLDPERMLLVDAGHFETERVFIDACVRRLSAAAERIPVHASRVRTNPVRFI